MDLSSNSSQVNLLSFAFFKHLLTAIQILYHHHCTITQLPTFQGSDHPQQCILLRPDFLAQAVKKNDWFFGLFFLRENGMILQFYLQDLRKNYEYRPLHSFRRCATVSTFGSVFHGISGHQIMDAFSNAPSEKRRTPRVQCPRSRIPSSSAKPASI